MRTRMLRLTATAGATALLVGIGAVATAGSASAATSAPATQVSASVLTHHHGEECCWRWTPEGWVWCCERDWDDHGWWGGSLISLNIG